MLTLISIICSNGYDGVNKFQKLWNNEKHKFLNIFRVKHNSSLKQKKLFIISYKYKKTGNNYSNMYILQNTLKSLLRFPLNIEYLSTYLRHKSCKKAIANKESCLSKRFLIVTFYEIALKYVSELKNRSVLLDILTNHNVGFARPLHLKFCHLIYQFKTFIML